MSAALATVLALAACGGPAGPGGPGGPGTLTTYLLLDDWTGRSVSVLATDAGLDELAFERSVIIGFDVVPCGMAIGPDDRVYVADYANGRVVVIDRDALLDGSAAGAARLATIEMTGFAQTCGVAFDAAGNMWVADRQGATPDVSQPNVLAQFDAAAVAAASGAVTLTPIRTLQPVHVTTITPDTFIASWWITSLTFDDQDRLWYTDRWRATVSRIDEPSAYPLGANVDVEPDMQLSNAPVVGDDPAVTFMAHPHSVAFDGAGNVFIGMNHRTDVLRYAVDDLPSTGRTFVLPAATLTLPIAQGGGPHGPLAVTVDDDGSLWAASNSGNVLMQVTGAATRDGDIAPDRATTWGTSGLTVGASFVWTSRASP